MDNISTANVWEENTNVISFNLIKGGKDKKEVRYNKDGSIDQRKCNKVAGESSEVYAFKTKEEIASMISVFNKHIDEATNEDQRKIACRNKMLFIIGINVGLRASDLRTLRFNFFFNEDGTFKESYTLQPKKQRKQHKFITFFFNDAIKSAINNYISEYPIDSLNDYLFSSRKGDDPLDEKSLCRIIKNAAKEAGIKQNIGSHSLRKTWGFWCFHEAKDKNKALVILQRCFNHSSTQVTQRYIGILSEEIQDMYNSINLGIDI